MFRITGVKVDSASIHAKANKAVSELTEQLNTEIEQEMRLTGCTREEAKRRILDRRNGSGS